MRTHEQLVAASFVFDADSLAPDGSVVVVRRSTDPVRANNSTVTVRADGLADGTYRLVSDRTLFEGSAGTSQAVALESGGSDGVELYGVSPSAAMNDATLILQTVGGMTLCTTNLTVLWVEISMRCGQDDNFSVDNDCSIKPTPAKLGAQRVFNNGLEVSMGNNVEFIGTVYPSDFIFRISMNRDNVNEMLVAKMTNGNWNLLSYIPEILRGVEPNCNDATDSEYQDRNPMPNGRVFDFDTPGINTGALANLPDGTILYEIQNFLQYSLWNQKRCSNDFPWFSRTSLVKNPRTSFSIFDFAFRADHPEDNLCGIGDSPLVVY